jgi:hypothetical protein
MPPMLDFSKCAHELMDAKCKTSVLNHCAEMGTLTFQHFGVLPRSGKTSNMAQCPNNNLNYVLQLLPWFCVWQGIRRSLSTNQVPFFATATAE